MKERLQRKSEIDKFSSVIRQFNESTRKVSLYVDVVRSGLFDFPNNLANPLKEQIQDDIKTFDSADDENQTVITVKTDYLEYAINSTSFAIENLDIEFEEFLKKSGEEQGKLLNEGFLKYLTDSLNSVKLIMYLTYAEALIKDILEIICEVEPKIMRNSENELKFKEILNFSDFEELNKYLIDVFVSSKLNGTFSSQCEALEKILSKEFKSVQKCNHEINKMIHIRNIFVHNGGKVDNKFIKETQLTNLNVGDSYHMSDKELEGYTGILHLIAVEIENVVLEQFFKTK